MVVGRPGDTITLQFSRPGTAKATPWRITLPRVLPRQTLPLPTRTLPPALMKAASPASLASPLTSPIWSSMIDSKGQGPRVIPVPPVGVGVVITCNEVWNNRYGQQDEAEGDYKRMVGQCVVSFDVNECLVSLVSFHVHLVSLVSFHVHQCQVSSYKNLLSPSMSMSCVPCLRGCESNN